MEAHQHHPLHEALKAQKAMRDRAGMPEESFPTEAFIGMVSDEIDALRERGLSDGDIAALIGGASSIKVTAAEIEKHYATPEQRNPQR